MLAAARHARPTDRETKLLNLIIVIKRQKHNKTFFCQPRDHL